MELYKLETSQYIRVRKVYYIQAQSPEAASYAVKTCPEIKEHSSSVDDINPYSGPIAVENIAISDLIMPDAFVYGEPYLVKFGDYSYEPDKEFVLWW